jgi:hypothetical protein
MNREDIVRMAREAGLVRTGDKWVEPARWGATELVHFADLISAAERQKSLRLWMLLDDIDTADDVAKADDKLYRSICQKHQKKRWEILSEEEVDAAIRARGEK